MGENKWIEKADAKHLKIRLRFLQKEDAMALRQDTWLLDGRLHMSDFTRLGKLKRDAEIVAIVAKLRTLESGW